MKKNTENLFIRADSTNTIGTGHVMRCIALAQAWQEHDGKVTFLSHCESDKIKQRILNEGFEFLPIKMPHPDPSDLKNVLNYLTAIRNPQSAIRNWIVLDGYHFTPDYQKAIRKNDYKLLVIDDMAHLDYYHADILVNQNINAPDLNYSCDKNTIQLLGCDYVMLRREFLEYKNCKREIPEKAKKILVTLGGADPDNVTLKVIETLKLLNDPDLEVKVVVGPSNPHLKKLQSAIRNPCPVKRETCLTGAQFVIHILQNVTDMPSLMARADMAITAGGTTCCEIAFMGLPYIILVLAENQKRVAEKLDEHGAAINLGWYEVVASDMIAKAFQEMVLEKEVRAKMSSCGRKIVDGIGGKRILMSMMVGKLTLRPVQEQDCKLIWKWANDPDVRAASFSSEYISWNDHFRWFNSKFNDPFCLYYIAMNEREIPVGQVRFEKNEKETIISISVDNKYRGSGYGSMIIKLASKQFFRVSDDQVVHAYIKKNNETSRHAFVEAGFKSAGTANICGKPAIHLRLQKNSLA